METNGSSSENYIDGSLFRVIVGDIAQQEADALVLPSADQTGIALSEPDPGSGLRCRYLIRVPSACRNLAELEDTYRTVLELAAEKACTGISLPLLHVDRLDSSLDYRIAERVFHVFLKDHEMRILFVVPDIQHLFISPSIDHGIRKALSWFQRGVSVCCYGAAPAAKSAAAPMADMAPDLPERERKSMPAKKPAAKIPSLLEKFRSRKDAHRKTEECAPANSLPNPPSRPSVRDRDSEPLPELSDTFSFESIGSMQVPAEKKEPLNPLFNDAQAQNLQKLLTRKNETFSQMLFRLMENYRNRDGSPMKEADLMRKACIDRRLLSKIRIDGYKPGSGPVQTPYHPSKDTAIQLAFALELPLNETNAFLEKAGYTLTDSLPEDIAVKFLIRERIYDVMNLQTVLLKVRNGGYNF